MTIGRGARSVAVLVALIAVVPAACHTSPKPSAIPEATSPLGEHVSVAFADGRTYVGELLAITDSTVMLLIEKRVAFARDKAITDVRGDKFEVAYANRSTRFAHELDRARRGARFPYGISPEGLAALLATTSQSAPDDLTATRP